MKTVCRFLMTALAASMLAAGGCGRRDSAPTMTYKEVLSSLLDTDRIADLSAPGSILYSSWDRTGGNEDHSGFQGDGPDGWKILVDIEGSGYLARFWSTGSKDGSKRIRFYLDGEKEPRLETTLDDWCGRMTVADHLPLRGYEPYCWLSWVPVSFSRRLVVMEEAPRPGEKLYYQINVVRLPPGEVAESWTPAMRDDPEVAALCEAVAARWKEAPKPLAPTLRATIEPGAEAVLWRQEGAGCVRDLRIVPQWADGLAASGREQALRSLVVRMYWDGKPEPSVEAPLGALCGVMWHEMQYSSLYFGMVEGACRLAFPMPFRNGARITVANQDTRAHELAVGVESDAVAPSASMGYFHANWRKTLASQTGSPHTIMKATGPGRYAGCLLGVRSLDPSFWVLEADEEMYVDGASVPVWRGTGLEDYFNGGWYYANAWPMPLHGLLFKAPYRTIQYRLHLADPVCFNNSFAMQFERGPGHASRAEMESVAYYYLQVPAPADSSLGDPAFRRPLDDPMQPYTLMTEVNNLERLGDISGAVKRIQAHLEAYPGNPFKDVLERRIARYATPAVIPEGQAVMGVYANTQVRVFLDGNLVADVHDPNAERVHFKDVPLPSGRHTLAIHYAWHPYPDWVQLMLEYPGGFLGTDNTWKYAFNPPGKWTAPDFDDSGWPQHANMWVKGPPEEPYVWCEPNDRPFTQSRAWGLRASAEWPAQRGFMVFRKTFQVP